MPTITQVHPSFVAYALLSVPDNKINATGVTLYHPWKANPPVPLQELSLLASNSCYQLQPLTAATPSQPSELVSLQSPDDYLFNIPTDHPLFLALPRLGTPSAPPLEPTVHLSLSDTHYLIQQNCPQLPPALIRTWDAPLILSLADVWPIPNDNPAAHADQFMSCALGFQYAPQGPALTSLKKSNPGYVAGTTLTNRLLKLAEHACGELFYDIETLLLFSALVPLLPAYWLPLQATSGPDFRAITYHPLQITPTFSNTGSRSQTLPLLSAFASYYIHLDLNGSVSSDPYQPEAQQSANAAHSIHHLINRARQESSTCGTTPDTLRDILQYLQSIHAAELRQQFAC